jgi:hypothetical protein
LIPVEDFRVPELTMHNETNSSNQNVADSVIGESQQSSGFMELVIVARFYGRRKTADTSIEKPGNNGVATASEGNKTAGSCIPQL